MPGLYPAFVRNEQDTCRVTQVIPTIPDGGNHTTGFREAACSVASHDTWLEVPKVLAAVGMPVLTNGTVSPESRYHSSFKELCFWLRFTG
ncbi:uncharacterized protein F5147DRAFT_25757 [Suillus discolor]|uniref:Uncharacterized protein n=1 Tax=Suillus discolor TaxID=1912936 RepID=A0A9P7EU09_9AGAM|nr:uncharacterized protein F5147DRAFT_25757 [Suillus discolor]KAG2090753.1 hypothetical protein F5147DRAFT_25757 [Suillus discolor]